MATEDLVGAGVTDELDETHRLASGAGTPVGREGKLPDAVLAAALLRMTLAEADGGDFGPGVDDARNAAIVHVHRLPTDHFGRDDAFLLSLVGEHRPGNAVADREDVRQVRPELGVDQNLAARAEREPERRGINPGERRLPPDRNEHVVAVESLALALLLDRDEDAVARTPSARDLRARADVEPLLAEDAVCLAHDVVVHAGKDRRQQLDDRHLRAEPAPHGAELETDHASADDDEMLRHSGNDQRADVREDALLVELEKGQLDRDGTGSDDDVLRLM